MNNQNGSTSTSLVLTPINGEPRIHDLNLAEKLGFERPVNVRLLIKRNSVKLEAFGPLFTEKRVINGGQATEFYLNKKQAIFLCMKSETDLAFEVQQEIVRVFDAWQNGTLQPAQPTTVPALFAGALHLIADQFGVIDQRLERQDKRLDTLQDLIVQVAHRRQRSGRFINPDQSSLSLYPVESPARARPCPHPRREHQRQLHDGRKVTVRKTFVGQRTH